MSQEEFVVHCREYLEDFAYIIPGGCSESRITHNAIWVWNCIKIGSRIPDQKQLIWD